MDSIWVYLCVGTTISLWLCCSVTHELYFFCYVIQIFSRWCDGVYIISKCSKFMDDRLFTIPCKVRWDVVYINVYSESMNLFWCFFCTAPFIFMLINIKNTCYYHIVDDFLCPSLFPLSQDASPPVVSMNIFNSSTNKFVTSVDFSNAISSSNLTSFHGCCSFISVIRTKQMMRTGALLDAVGNTHIILEFYQTNLSMDVKPRMEVTL